MGVNKVVDFILIIFVVGTPFISVYGNVILLIHSNKVIAHLFPDKVSKNCEPAVLCIGLSLIVWVLACCVVAYCLNATIRPLFLTALDLPPTDQNGLLLNFFRGVYSILLVGAAIGGPLSLYITARSPQTLTMLASLLSIIAVSFLVWDAFYSFSFLRNAVSGVAG